MNELEYLYKLRTDMMTKYYHVISISKLSSINNIDNIECSVLKQEIEYIDSKILHLQNGEYSERELRERIKTDIYSTIIDDPNFILSCMNVSDIERFLRQKKLNKINKKSDC